MRRTGRVLWLLIALVLMSSGLHAEAPGFDCARAETPTEKFICSDQRLSALDAKMSSLYDECRQSMPAGDAAVLQQEQKQWLQKRDAACNIDALITSSSTKRDCLNQLYLERIKALYVLNAELMNSKRSAARPPKPANPEKEPKTVQPEKKTSPLKGKPALAMDSALRPETSTLKIRRITPDGR